MVWLVWTLVSLIIVIYKYRSLADSWHQTAKQSFIIVLTETNRIQWLNCSDIRPKWSHINSAWVLVSVADSGSALL